MRRGAEDGSPMLLLNFGLKKVVFLWCFAEYGYLRMHVRVAQILLS